MRTRVCYTLNRGGATSMSTLRSERQRVAREFVEHRSISRGGASSRRSPSRRGSRREATALTERTRRHGQLNKASTLLASGR